MGRKASASLLAVGAFASLVGARSAPAPETVASIAAVRSVVARSGDSVWPGFARAPFGFLYLDENGELLLDDTRLPPGFTRGADGLASGPPSWRKPAMLAAMPVFGPPSVIVMGPPEASGRDPAAWQRIVIHEHFHQWQAELPGYYDRVAALDLSGGDQTGMWMLNYPFPYKDSKVGAAYADASRALAAALSTPRGPALRRATSAYLKTRAALAAAVTAPQWRYFDFQLWQEGVARWTEIAVAARSGNKPLAAAGAAQLRELKAELLAPDLARRERVSVYALGGGEALLLDRIDPDWRGCYRVSLGLDPCWRSLTIPGE